MRKLVYLVVLLLSVWGLKAQQLEQGNSLINLGVGMGSYIGSGSGYKTTLPPLEVSYEYLVNDNISVGGFFAMTKSEFNYSFPDLGGGSSSPQNFKFNYSYMMFGAIGNYHFVNNDKFDVYGGVRIGYNKVNVDYSSDDATTDSLLKSINLDSSGMLFGAQVGGRYFFTDNLAVNMEVGYGLAIAKLGLTFKL